MARLSGKLTAKTLGWDRNAIGTATSKVPAIGGRVHLGRIVGVVGGLKSTVNGDTGEIQNGLKGQFRGLSTLTDDGQPAEVGKGTVVTAGVCYLPGGIQEMIEGALASAQDTTNGGNAKATVQFAIDLFAIPATNKAGYSFDAENLVEASQADPLDALLVAANSEAPENVPLLADETGAAVKEETPAPEAAKTAKK